MRFDPHTPRGDTSTVLTALTLPEPGDRIVMALALPAWTVVALATTSDFAASFVLSLLFAAFYYVATALLLRHVALSGLARVLFCFGAVPLYLAMLLFAAKLLLDLAPDTEFAYDRRVGIHRRRMSWALPLVVGAPALLLWGAYRGLRRIAPR